MKKQFYSHLISIESIIAELDQLGFDSDEKIYLANLVDTNLHHTIMDLILSELNDDEKNIFLSLLTKDDQSKIWEHLNIKIDSIENKIITASENLKEELRQDLKQAKKRKVSKNTKI